jgi:hypothetical protein
MMNLNLFPLMARCLEDPCLASHGGAHDVLPIMPISYRAEPMVNREQKLFKLMKENYVFDKNRF